MIYCKINFKLDKNTIFKLKKKFRLFFIKNWRFIMIHAILIFNSLGKTRLAKFYEDLTR